ncbi:MAG: OpgC domain-containing protein [Planctomycetota bacterium]
MDFFRGVALLWILTNHIALSGSRPAPAIFHVLPPYWGYTSGLEVFVFLSGLVFGIVHLHAQQERGLFFSQVKSVHRACRLYVMNAFTVVMVLALASLFITRRDPRAGPAPATVPDATQAEAQGILRSTSAASCFVSCRSTSSCCWRCRCCG